MKLYKSAIMLCFLYNINTYKVKAQNIIDTINHTWSFHFQQTSVYQWHYNFDASYSGDFSLSNKTEDAISLTSTLFIARSLWKNANLVFNPELAGGSGLSQARGLAGFCNGETFRVGDPRPSTYIARMFVEQKFALNNKTQLIKDDANAVQGYSPTSYIGVVIGKYSNADYFDCNQYSHDPRSQFLNWALMSTGAWDYAANTRGYTYGIVLQYITPNLSLRYSLSEVPTVANGPELENDLSTYNAHSFEIEKPYRIKKRKGIVRLLAFYNNANMRNYNNASKNTTAPNDKNIRNKYGFSVNIEQELNNYVGCFVRASYNDGNNETWAFTEIDQSLSLGFSASGSKWKRKEDAFGIAGVINGISVPHQTYLKAGGYGFIIGDGNLSYAPEMITEIYYSALIHDEHFWLTPNYQFVANPAYNSDRGAVSIFGLRLHTEF